MSISRYWCQTMGGNQKCPKLARGKLVTSTGLTSTLLYCQEHGDELIARKEGWIGWEAEGVIVTPPPPVAAPQDVLQEQSDFFFNRGKWKR